jgi:hypothetical protein
VPGPRRAGRWGLVSGRPLCWVRCVYSVAKDLAAFLSVSAFQRDDIRKILGSTCCALVLNQIFTAQERNRKPGERNFDRAPERIFGMVRAASMT